MVDDTVTQKNLPPNSPEARAREMFRQNLYKAMLRKGLNQSQLGRQVGIGRDVISTYIRGRSLPEPLNAQKLADFFGMEVTDLLPPPNRGYDATMPANPALRLEPSEDKPGLFNLHLNMALPFEAVTAVLQVVQPYLPADARGLPPKQE